MNLYQLSDGLRHEIISSFNFEIPHVEINKKIANYMDAKMCTSSGNKRHPNYYRIALNQVAFQIVRMLEDEKIIFGYFYNDEFYATDKKQVLHKTTEALHAMRLEQKLWDNMRKGMFYSRTLKPYFE